MRTASFHFETGAEDALSAYLETVAALLTCRADGTTIGEQSVTTVAHMEQGTEKVDIVRVVCSTSGAAIDPDSWTDDALKASYSISSGVATIVVTVKSGTDMGDGMSVDIELTDADGDSRTCTLRLAAARAGGDGGRGADGITVDLTNQAVQVGCDGKGWTKAEQARQTTVRAWSGTTPITLTQIFCTMYVDGESADLSSNYAASGIAAYFKASVQPATGLVTLTVREGTGLGSDMWLAITARRVVSGSVVLQRQVNMQVIAVRGSVFYDIEAPDAIVASRDASGGYVAPPSPVLTLGYKKSTNDDASIVAAATESFDGLNLYFRRRLRSTKAWESDYILYTGTGQRHANARSLLANLDVSTYDGVDVYISADAASSYHNVDGMSVNYRTALSSWRDHEEVWVISDGASSVQRWVELSPASARVTSDGFLVTAIEPIITLWNRQEGGAAHRLTESESLAESVMVDGRIEAPNGTVYIDENAAIDDYFIWNSQEQRWEWDNAAHSIPAGVMVRATLVVTWYTDSSRTAYYDQARIILERQGQDAEPTAILSLQPTPTIVNLRSNAAGEFPAQTVSVACVVKKTVGDIITELDPGSEYPFAGKYYLYWKHENLTRWQPGVVNGGYDDAVFSSASAVAGNISKVSFVLSTASAYTSVAAANIMLQVDVPVVLDGRRGPAGATGRIPFPMGKYDPTVEYTRTTERYPLVHYDNGDGWNQVLQCKGHYYYLIADTNVVGDVHIAPDNSYYWQQADDFGIVITMGLFAEFAKVGSGVVSGDYVLSANGRIGTTEYVNGQTIDGVPAYVRFLGDPTTLKGSISKTALTGYDSTHRYVLQTVTLVKGTRLTASIVGSATANYFYFRLYKKDGDAVTGTVALNTTRDTRTLAYTATADGEYTIECYGGTTAIKSTFDLTWVISGHFQPNLFLDLLTGKISGAKGNFVVDGGGDVTVVGTVRAKNLFKTIALANGGDINYEQVRAIVLTADGGYDGYVYVRADVDEETYGHVFLDGEYWLGSEMDAVVDSGSVGMWKYDSDNFILCTGPADEVLLVDDGHQGNFGGEVYLPRCQDYPGKQVVIRHTMTAGNADAKILQVDLASRFVRGIYTDSYVPQGSSVAVLVPQYGTHLEQYLTLSAGQTMTLYSTGSLWVLVRIE